MSAQAIVALTDAQLEYIKSLCAEREYPQPVVYCDKHMPIARMADAEAEAFATELYERDRGDG